MRQISVHVPALHFFIILLFTSLTYALTLDEHYPRQATDACAPACADRNALQEACTAARDGDCCRPTYGSAHLTCAYCLSFQPGISDEQRERLHRSAQAYVERMSADCAKQGQPLQPASVTLTVTPTATAATKDAGTKTTAKESTSGTNGSSSSNSNSNSGTRAAFENWVLASLFCASVASVVLVGSG